MNEPTVPLEPPEPLAPPVPDILDEATPAPAVRRLSRVRGIARIVSIFVAIGLLIVLTLQNTDPVYLRILAWTYSPPLALLVFVLIVVGVLVGWLLRSMRDDDGFRLFG